MHVIDLSVAINERTPVYPGDPVTKIAAVGVFAKDGWNDHYVSIGTHVGTHIDAPLHMIDGGAALNDIPVEQFIGRGRYIRVDGAFDIEKIRDAQIQPGDIVLFHTGMSDSYYQTSYFEKYPVMSEEIANYLVGQNIKMVGFDTCSPDNTDGFPIHKILLGGNILIIENLTNLAPLAGREFTVYALPLKFELDGSPARVVAVIHD